MNQSEKKLISKEYLTLISGPCAIESEKLALDSAEYLCDLTEKLGIRGKPINLELRTLNQKQTSETYVVPNLIVSSLVINDMLILKNVCILDHIPVKKTYR